MRTPKKLYTQKMEMYSCEIENCPTCESTLVMRDYCSGRKIIQTLSEVMRIGYRPKYCPNGDCRSHQINWKSARWQQQAPAYCSYGYEVIAWVGWHRQNSYQPFEQIHEAISSKVQISESEVRHLYYQRYLPLLACHERTQIDRLIWVSEQSGLILTLDGLAPEGGEPQLWVIRELHTALTLRSGWLSCQDQPTFENFLKPVAELNLKVTAILSDKQRGLLPAVGSVFPQAKHAFCQAHYFNNLAEPVAKADEAMKVTLRQIVRQEVGDLIRSEHVESQGVLTVTGLIPSPLPADTLSEESGLDPEELNLNPGSLLCGEASLDEPGLDPEELDPPVDSSLQVDKSPDEPLPSTPTVSVEQQRQAIIDALLSRVRYVLTLKGRPPFGLAGIEMFQQLREVLSCLKVMLGYAWDERLERLQNGLTLALQLLAPEYKILRQVADWLENIRELLDPDGKPDRTGREVHGQLFNYLDSIVHCSQGDPVLTAYAESLYKTTCNYESGLFYTYDVDGLPRTNNDRESEFRELNRRLLITTGQKGAKRRIIQRSGAWELVTRPGSFAQTVSALSNIDYEDFVKERNRVRIHRNRFKFHTRSTKLAKKQLEKLQVQWLQLSTNSPSG